MPSLEMLGFTCETTVHVYMPACTVESHYFELSGETQNSLKKLKLVVNDWQANPGEMVLSLK